jgi:hypothetical protein
MEPIRTSICNATFVAPGCADLPGSVGDGFVSTYWRPDAEELALIAAGFPIKLSFRGSAPPPVAVEVDTL